MPIGASPPKRRSKDWSGGVIRCKMKKTGDRAGIRTRDLLIKSQLLYRLSYAIICERG